jgi:hypothetical protein
MSKSIVRAACGLLILSIVIAGLAGCSSTEEPDYAGEMVESTLQAINDGDYAAYLEYFSPEAQSTLSEDDFNTNVQLIKDNFGDYIDKEFWKTEPENGYLGVHYKVAFSNMTESLILSAYFEKIDAEIYIAGFWLSPQS